MHIKPCRYCCERATCAIKVMFHACLPRQNPLRVTSVRLKCAMYEQLYRIGKRVSVELWDEYEGVDYWDGPEITVRSNTFTGTIVQRANTGYVRVFLDDVPTRLNGAWKNTEKPVVRVLAHRLQFLDEMDRPVPCTKCMVPQGVIPPESWEPCWECMDKTNGCGPEWARGREKAEETRKAFAEKAEREASNG